MTRVLRKWNYKKHDYEPYEVPDDWKLVMYTDNMDEITVCPHCGKEVAFGDTYTSMEVHTDMGFGYMVCEDCYEEEWKRRRLAKENERMSISGLLDVLNTGIALSTCHMEYAIQGNVFEDLIGCLEELEKYRAIGTLEEFKSMKEKRTAKSRLIAEGKYFCPECGRTADMGYCKACGQNLY